MIKSGKSKKQPIFFQRGWEIVAFFEYISTKKLLPCGPFGPSGNSFFVLMGLCLGIVIVYKMLTLHPTYARARAYARCARGTRQPNSIVRLVKDDAPYAPQFSAPRPP